MLGGGEDSVARFLYGYGFLSRAVWARISAPKPRAPWSFPCPRQHQAPNPDHERFRCHHSVRATPSSSLLIADTQEMGASMDEFKLTGVILGAERCSEATRRDSPQVCVQYCDVYGLPKSWARRLPWSAPEANGLHLCEDQFLAEIVNPDTFEPVPDGESASSSLPRSRASAPRSFAIARATLRASFRASAPAAVRIRKSTIVGRTDDMLIIRGVNVFPVANRAGREQLRRKSPHYQIVLTTKGHARPNRAARGNRPTSCSTRFVRSKI